MCESGRCARPRSDWQRLTRLRVRCPGDGVVRGRFAFNIVWRLVVNGDGQVRCDLRFLPRCKAEGAAAKTGFAPRFQSLVRLRGIERALHILVDLVTAG